MPIAVRQRTARPASAFVCSARMCCSARSMNARVAGDSEPLGRVTNAKCSSKTGSEVGPVQARREPAPLRHQVGHQRVAHPVRGQLDGGGLELHLHRRVQGHARALGALGEAAAQRVVAGPARLGEDQPAPAQLLDVHRTVRAVRVGAHVHDGVGQHRVADPQTPVVDGQLHQTRLQVALADRVGDLRGVQPLDADGHVRVEPAELGRERREQVQVGAAERAERDGAARELAHVADRAGQVVDVAQHLLRPGHEHPPGVGRLQLTVRAGEERDAERALQAAYLVGQARLGDVERRGGGREGAVLDRGEEVDELLQRRSTGGHRGVSPTLARTVSG